MFKYLERPPARRLSDRLRLWTAQRWHDSLTTWAAFGDSATRDQVERQLQTYTYSVSAHCQNNQHERGPVDECISCPLDYLDTSLDFPDGWHDRHLRLAAVRNRFGFDMEVSLRAVVDQVARNTAEDAAVAAWCAHEWEERHRAEHPQVGRKRG